MKARWISCVNLEAFTVVILKFAKYVSDHECEEPSGLQAFNLVVIFCDVTRVRV
jgi:hypothetical protein